MAYTRFHQQRWHGRSIRACTEGIHHYWRLNPFPWQAKASAVASLHRGIEILSLRGFSGCVFVCAGSSLWGLGQWALFTSPSPFFALQGLSNGFHNLRIIAVGRFGEMNAVPVDKFWESRNVSLSTAFELVQKPPRYDPATSASFLVAGYDSGTYVWRINGGSVPCVS